MKKRMLSLLLAGILCMGMFVGCGMEKPPAEKQIVEDVNTFGIDAIEEDGAVITDCEIIKRQTNEDEKEDIVYCRLFSEEGYCRAEYQFKLIYNYYDEGGWILDAATPENQDEWVQTYVDGDGNDVMDKVVWLEGTFEEAESNGMDFPIEVRDEYDYGIADFATGRTIVSPWSSGWNRLYYFSKAPSGRIVAAVEEDSCGYLINEKGEQISDTYESMTQAGQLKHADGTREALYAGGIGSTVYVMNGDEKIYCTVPGSVDRKGRSDLRNLDVDFDDIEIGIYAVEVDHERYEGLIDLSGNIIVPATKYHYLQYITAADCYIVGDLNVEKYGAIDKKGNVLIPVEYSRDEVRKKLGLSNGNKNYPDAVQKVAEAEGMELYNNGDSDRYIMRKAVYKPEYNIEIEVYSMVDEKGYILIDQFEGFLQHAYAGTVRAVSWDLETVCYFDYDGNQRTPKFQYVYREHDKEEAMKGVQFGQMYGHYSHDLFEYNGRQGVFADLLTEKEIAAFKK